MDFIGIDFGARAAGTTVICHRERGLFRFERSDKGGDADTWLQERILQMRPSAIYLDAPLSLPGAYYGKSEDHFFRLADRLAGGMSPMFLGGLTARAIRLAQQWRMLGIRVFEVYPSGSIRHKWDFLKIPAGRSIPAHKLRLMAGVHALPPPITKDRHEADAWLCWLIGLQHQQGNTLQVGDPEEGVILM
ncbi:MAG: hypothetical protein KF905_07125 [Flavobacteriales bacterium]|nr:hypothetical protein [Flavobacteriales bacterium]